MVNISVGKCTIFICSLRYRWKVPSYPVLTDEYGVTQYVRVNVYDEKNVKGENQMSQIHFTHISHALTHALIYIQTLLVFPVYIDIAIMYRTFYLASAVFN